MAALLFESGVLDEPQIIFGGHQRHVDPKGGLASYGPYTQDASGSVVLRNSIIVGIVGPANLVGDGEQWITSCSHHLTGTAANPYQSPSFPGFTAAFRSGLVTAKSVQLAFRAVDLEAALATRSDAERVTSVARLYVDGIGILRERDRSPDVVLCCISNDIYKRCLIDAVKKARHRRDSRDRDRGLDAQLALFAALEPNVQTVEDAPLDLWKAIKAGAMAHAVPTQLMLEDSLAIDRVPRSVQDLATRAWNFSVAVYHKAGGSPWRIAEIDQGVCFVGISFFRDPNARDTRMRTSLAQAFTAGGDGYVLRGQSFIWDQKQHQERSPHMDEASATALVKSVIDHYKTQHNGHLPSRLVIHKSSQFWTDELRGFKAGAAALAASDYVAFRGRGLQLYRQGNYPPLRGTYIKFDAANQLLYTRGYVPYLGTYPGSRSPQPLEIAEHHGDSSWRTVLSEILALTKMNWNSADFSGAYPITIRFARNVGELLAEIPVGDVIRPEYRFYM